MNRRSPVTSIVPQTPVRDGRMGACPLRRYKLFNRYTLLRERPPHHGPENKVRSALVDTSLGQPRPQSAQPRSGQSSEVQRGSQFTGLLRPSPVPASATSSLLTRPPAGTHCLRTSTQTGCRPAPRGGRSPVCRRPPQSVRVAG